MAWDGIFESDAKLKTAIPSPLRPSQTSLIQFQALMGFADFGHGEDAIDVGAENAVSEKGNDFRGEEGG